MSGHSKWAKIHRKKGVADAKRGAAFTKAGNLITMAARHGGDPDTNFKLRLAIDRARAVNMPKDKIEKAIARGAGTSGEAGNLEEITYEAYGPAGTAFIIEAITDNKNRTLTDVKTALNKNGGNLAGAGSVAWLFDRKGIIVISEQKIQNQDEDDLELKIIDAGAEDIIKDGDWEIHTAMDQLQKTANNLKKAGIEFEESSLAYVAKNEIKIEDAEKQKKIERLYEALDELDDVNNVYTNAQ